MRADVGRDNRLRRHRRGQGLDDVAGPHGAGRRRAIGQHPHPLVLKFPERRRISIPRRRRPLVGERVEERAVADEHGPRRHDAAGIWRFEQPVNRPFGMPRLVDFHRIEAEADDQIRRGNRVAHDAVGRHPAGDADEAGGGLVDDPLDLRRHGDRQTPLCQPAPDRCRVRRIDAEPNHDERALRAPQCGHELSRLFAGAGAPGSCRRDRARCAVGRRLQRLASGQREVRHAERALHAAGHRLRHHVEHVRAGDLLDVARDRPVGLVQRQPLVRVAGREIVRDLRRDRQQRLEVQIGVRHRQHQVRRARTERRQHDARLAA